MNTKNRGFAKGKSRIRSDDLLQQSHLALQSQTEYCPPLSPDDRLSAPSSRRQFSALWIRSLGLRVRKFPIVFAIWLPWASLAVSGCAAVPGLDGNTEPAIVRISHEDGEES